MLKARVASLIREKSLEGTSLRGEIPRAGGIFGGE